jgi:tRNA wybutosine-synthesizing protein 1
MAAPDDMIPENIQRLLERQHYKLVGNHSAVKLCHWTKKSLLGEGSCYKQRFYGIQSHRCLQMTPAVAWCTHKCLFCWRFTEWTLGTELEQCDAPEAIIDEAVEKQRVLLSGFGGIPERVDKKKLEEARDPNQAAISLAGEPMLYPDMSGLLREFHKRDFTTFLVSNGTLPERIESLDELPTNLYISVDAPNEKLYKNIDFPLVEGGWSKINKSLELMPSLSTTKVIRLTLVKGLNMVSPEEYAKLISKAEPDFIEVKAYMFVGGSRRRLSLDNMPSHQEVRDFSAKLAEELGYHVKDGKADSRVVLISRI